MKGNYLNLLTESECGADQESLLSTKSQMKTKSSFNKRTFFIINWIVSVI